MLAVILVVSNFSSTAGVKRIFLVSRGKLKDDKVRMATGTVFVSEKELIKVVVKRLVTTNVSKAPPLCRP